MTVGSLTSSLKIATNSLQASQLALGIVSHNIANVHTEGYNRQIVDITAANYGGFGGGATVSGISRQIDKVLLARITAQTAQTGYSSTYRGLLQNVETLLAQGDAGLDKLTTRFFQELSVLSNQTESSAQRLNVVQNATNLANELNKISSELVATRNDIDLQINDELEVMNTLVKQIAQLNDEIMRIETSSTEGVNANDLRDRQQNLINELSTRIKINTVKDSNGRTNVYAENGRRLVDQAGYVQFTREASSGTYQNISVRSILSNGEVSSNPLELDFSRISAGSLKAMVDVRDTTITQLQGELDEFAQTMITEFNKIHSRGTSVPPEQTLTSGLRNGTISNTTSDLFSEVGTSLADSSFDISIVNKATGEVISTTLTAGGGAGPITLPSAPGPFSLADLETLIEANADVAGDLTIDVAADADGNPYISITANNSAYGVVLANNTGDVLGDLEMNRFFTGSSAGDIAVRSDIAASPSKLATAQMRSTDGGLSLLDNSNAIALADLGTTDVTFDAAGNLPGMSKNMSGYAIQILSSFAVRLQESGDQVTFNDAVLSDMKVRNSGLSGVNLDEELSNLMLFQNSYQASARVLQVIDELLEQVISVTR
jgi:flagellar hook-associated protein 1 FlgK